DSDETKWLKVLSLLNCGLNGGRIQLAFVYFRITLRSDKIHNSYDLDKDDILLQFSSVKPRAIIFCIRPYNKKGVDSDSAQHSVENYRIFR
ncbi:hypothetical protein L9F63_022374, partial [Diploptera punctata]